MNDRPDPYRTPPIDPVDDWEDIAFEYAIAPDGGRLSVVGDTEPLTGYMSSAYQSNAELWRSCLDTGTADSLAASLARNNGLADQCGYVTHRDGGRRWARIRLVAEYDEHGQIGRLEGRIWNPDRESALVRALEESDARFRAIIDNAPFGVLVHRWGEVQIVNDATRLLLGYEKNEPLEERAIMSSVAEKDRQRLAEIADRRQRGLDAPSQYEINLLRKDGTTRPAIVGVLTFPWRGETLHMVTITDLAPQKEAEEALRRHVALEQFITSVSTNFINIEPEAIEERIHEAIDQLGVLLGVDRCSVMLLAGDADRFASSYTWADENVEPHDGVVVGKTLAEFLWALEVFDRDEVLHVPRVDQMPPEAQKERELFEALNDKSVLVFPMRIAKSLIGIFAVETVHEYRQWSLQDIAILKILGQVFAYAYGRMRAELQRRKLEEWMRESQKLESLGVLAGGIAHDFNNLLMVVLGHANFALTDGGAPGPIREHLEEIEAAAKRAAELTKQMLTYTGSALVEQKECDVAQLLEDAALLLAPTDRGRVEIDAHAVAQVPPILADAAQARQAVSNLLTNALEALPPEQGAVRVSAEALVLDSGAFDDSPIFKDVAPGPYVAVRIADDGHGMSVDTLDRIFDPFFTTRFTGRGLGLASTLGIMRGHHGAIQVQSAPQKGTIVTLYFPTRQESTDRPALPEEGESAPGVQRVALIIDDEPSVLRIAARVLQELGFETLTAESGAEARARFEAERGRIDFILADATMPDCYGASLIQEFVSKKPSLRVLLSSGYSQESPALKHSRLRDIPFLQKPYLPIQLEQMVRSVLSKD